MIFFFIMTITIIEMGLSLSHLSIKHNQTFRHQLRLGYFLCAILLLITEIVTLSLTYLPFYIWLCVIGVASIIRLLKQPKHPFVYKERYKTIRFILVMYLLLMPAILIPNYKPLTPTGSYAIRHEVVKLINYHRIDPFSNKESHRQINLEIWYPETQHEKFPVIVYSHGGISHARSHQSLFLELASHGYVLISVDHTYHSLSVNTKDSKNISIHRTYLNQLMTENAQKNPEGSYNNYLLWMELRTEDLMFVVDTIIERTQDAQQDVFKIIDVHKIGVMGHSLGGSAAMCLGNLRDDISAIMALESPMFCDIIGVDDHKFVFREYEFKVPLLHIYTDSSWHNLSKWGQYGQNFNLLKQPSDHTYAVYFQDMYHFGLTDLSLSNPLLSRLLNGFKKEISADEGLRRVNQITRAYFDDYLKSINDFSAHAWLWTKT